MPDWNDPNWLEEAHAWIREQLAHLDNPAVGAIEAVHVQPWATVLRVPTNEGDAYFKANTEALRHEAAVVALLGEVRPDCIPRLFAADRERGWMLMADAGTRLRELVARERDLARWLDVLPLYAGVQLDLVGRADELVAVGVPDLRLATLPAQYERTLDELDPLPADETRRLREAVPRVVEMCHELAAHGLPETLQHDDLNDGQIYLREGRYLILDWGDACVSHPFFSLSVALEGVIAWGVDDIEGSVDVEPFRNAYLEPFTRKCATTTAELASVCNTAMRLGWVCRAVNGHLSGSDAPETRVRLRMFLDGRP